MIKDPHDLLADPKMHPDMVKVLRTAEPGLPVAIQITVGGRTQAQEDTLVAAGRSKTRRSRHVYEQNQGGLCCAVDFVVLKPDDSADWVVGDPETGVYAQAGKFVVGVAAGLGVRLQWGGAKVGAWTDGVVSGFHDYDHLQLDPSMYPQAA